MARVLPIAMAQAKEEYENFFIELYTMKLPSGEMRLVACDEDIDFDGKSFMAVPLQRNDFKQSVDGKIDNMELQIADVDQSMTLALFQGFDFRGCECTITRILYPNSIDDPSIRLDFFCGLLDAPYMNNTMFKVSLIAKAPNQQAPNRKCQLSCNADFADPDECEVSLIVKSGTISYGSTQSKIYDSNRTEPDGFWQDGIVTIGYESRKIKRYTEGIIYLEYPFIAQISDQYLIEQGCDKTFATCKARFNNGRNFSGFPSVPFELVIKS